MVSTKCISNTTGNVNNQWENCISLDFNFHSLSKLRNPRKLEPCKINNDLTVVEFIASKQVKVSNWFAKLFIYLRQPV